jgi:hypothetical protein
MHQAARLAAVAQRAQPQLQPLCLGHRAEAFGQISQKRPQQQRFGPGFARRPRRS